jgi:glycosyltransferase involved in cell wall biosynthesis
MKANKPSTATHVLHVAIDARLMYYRRAGIAQYTRHLTRALAQSHTTFGIGQLSVLLDRRDRDTAWVPPGVNVLRTVTPAHHRYEHLFLPLELARYLSRFDVLHSPDFIAPHGRFKKIITIHDLYFLEHPEVMEAVGKRYYSRMSWSAHIADHIIAVSDFTRREITRLLPQVPEVKVSVIHEAGANQLPVSALDAPAESLQYALFVGTFEPRKNLVTLLRALKDLPDDVRLMIIGERGWGTATPARVALELGVKDRVTFAGRVSDAELDRYYRGARMLVMPSLSEGFGLPVLEAMARGVPVVCSNAGALAEIAGDAALMHDPLDVAALARLMRVVWTSDAVRGDYGRRGLQRARDFSWDGAAQATWRVYHTARES